MDNYGEEQFKSFLEGMKKAAEMARDESPNFYLVGLNGGGPLFDILRIIDRDIQESSAIYFPTSSKIKDCKKVATRCWENFFLEKKDETDKPRKILSIDEVVGGHSVERILNAYESASRRVARGIYKGGSEETEREATRLKELFPLKIMGIRDDRQTPMNLTYLTNVKEGKIKEVPVKKIITMDYSDFHIVKFKHPTSSGWNGQSGFFPEIERFDITNAYLNLLKRIAGEVGADPQFVNVGNMERMRANVESYSRKPSYSK